jgi:pimeloyl-ACP methyl ester carboxylesterase
VAPAFLLGEAKPMDADARRGAAGTFVELRHGVTHVVVDGPESGEPVVFMPGATLPLSLWDGLSERLAEAGHRAIRYDRYGLGFSDRPHVEYDHDLLDEQLVELLDALDVERPANLVGLAFGCPIAAEFALRRPDSVARMCLIAPDGFAPTMRLGARLGLMPYLGAPFSQIFGSRALKARVPGYSDDEGVTGRVMAQLERELRYRGFKRALRSAVRNLPIDHGESLYRRVNAGDIPVQLIWGTADVVTPVPSQAVLRDVFSDADIRLLDGVGHLPHYERVVETSALVREFLAARS